MDTRVRTADGIELFARKLGSGGTAIIIPNAVSMAAPFERLAARHTVIFFDLRNRGRSDAVEDPALIARGVEHDVDDIETIRADFGIERAVLIGHSYIGLVIALYAMRHPERVSRMIQISPPPHEFGHQYQPPLSYTDERMSQIWADLQALEPQRASLDPIEFCRKWWALARPLFVANPAHAAGIADWGFCDLPNERNFMKHWMRNITPSLQRLHLAPEDFARVTCPVLTIHGTKDRSAPYGAGVEWSERLPHGRLVTIEGVAHVPWVEAPDLFWSAVDAFLEG
ncbi:MAG TPA: alpha/beta hydrolase [Bryobacteraceae bacterium]|jgi:pimeloyl-ACP methyl ester carboxylesterase